MSRSWVKLHLKILDSLDMEMLPGETYKRAIQLLCMAGVEDTDGWLPEVSRMAYKFHTSHEQLVQEMNHLLEIEFLAYDSETGGWRINNWAVYQTNSDPGVNERVRRYREKMKRKKNGIIKEDGNVTRNVTSENGNADVTQQDIDKDNIPQTREDTEIGADAPPPAPIPANPPEAATKPVKAVTKSTKAAGKEPDPRSKSPQILAYRELTGSYPPLPTYDAVISAVGERTKDELLPYRAVWIGAGHSPMNQAWLTDWSINGIPSDTTVPDLYASQVERGPPRYGKGARASPDPPSVDPFASTRGTFRRSLVKFEAEEALKNGKH